MRVLISGAGVAGPTLAFFLAKAGSHVVVVEKSADLLSQGQNIDIEGTALEVIKKMGLLEKIREFNTTEKGTQFIGPDGRPFASFPMKEGYRVSPTSENEILRGDLVRVLYEASRDHPNVSYIFGTTIKEVVSNNDDGVKVELSNGEKEEFDVLVAADGQWSKVRRQCVSPESVKVVDMGMYTCFWTIPRQPNDNDLWNVYMALGKRLISIRPDPYGTTRVCITSMPCNDVQKKEWQEVTRSDKKIQKELVRKDFADAGWQAQRVTNGLSQTSDFYFQAVQQIRMDKWYQSRLVCVGDAAYAPTPLTGMGTSLALIGAYVLAGELSQLREGDHPRTAFEAYDTKLRPFVEEVQKIPSFAPGIFHPDKAWKRWLIQTVISVFSTVIAIALTIPWTAKKLQGEDMDVFDLSPYPVFDDGDDNHDKKEASG